jgi:hypothetical protein
MDPYDEDEPTELQLEQDRAGRDASSKDDVFDRLEETTWLAPIDDAGGKAAPAQSDDEMIADPDAERAAEHQLAATGRPVVRFLPDDLHHRPGDEDNGS